MLSETHITIQRKIGVFSVFTANEYAVMPLLSTRTKRSMARARKRSVYFPRRNLVLRISNKLGWNEKLTQDTLCELAAKFQKTQSIP